MAEWWRGFIPPVSQTVSWDTLENSCLGIGSIRCGSPELYSVADLAELYRSRWQVETARAHLKTTMQMDVLYCKTVPGVLKELTVFAIIDNLVRMVMWQSATLPHTAIERISFLDARRWLSAPSTGMPLGAVIVHPTRPHRVEPRVKKRRPQPFPLMMKPRQALRQRLFQQRCRS